MPPSLDGYGVANSAWRLSSMLRHVIKERVPWEDRFREPTSDELLAAMPKQHLATFDHARGRLLAIDGVRETIGWHGIPWRWAMSYRTAAETPHAISYLIPQPGRPLLAIPIPVEMLATIPLKKHTRVVRDGITFSAEVAGVYWPTWDLTGKTLVDELFTIIRRKLETGLVPTA
jgi:hypothetical protein